jgi:hypothetical protein
MRGIELKKLSLASLPILNVDFLDENEFSKKSLQLF